MSNLRFMLGCLILCLFTRGRMQALPIYYNTSSTTLSLNTLASVATNGTGNATLLTATGIDFNQVNRCTAMAVDGLNGKLFLIDGAAGAIWSVNLNGSGLALVKKGLTNYPTDLALDVLNQKIYYTTSSTIQGSNTVQRVDYTGNNNTILFTATGSPNVSRCTAIAVDVPHSKIFIADAGTQKIWSMGLGGGGLSALATATNAVPVGLALDTTNQRVYFTVSSPVQNSNLILRVSYGGSGQTTLFTASGRVLRCTALDLDVADGAIYLSDAGVNTLWRVPIGGGSATSVLSGLAATARKVRWFGGPTARPFPGFTTLSFSSGTNVVLNATNGFIGGTYYMLTSTNVALPFSQWQPVATNVLGASGKFALTATNGFTAAHARFFILQEQ